MWQRLKTKLKQRMLTAWQVELNRIVTQNHGSMAQTQHGDWALRSNDGSVLAIVDFDVPTTLWLATNLEPIDAAQITAIVAVAVGGAERLALGTDWDPDWGAEAAPAPKLSVIRGSDEIH